jgi:putative ABC transport system substrate-binding protein
LLPNVSSVGLLVNRANPSAEAFVTETEKAARALHLETLVVHASTEPELVAGFATLARQRIGALVVIADVFFTNRRMLIALLAARHGIPASYPFRDFVIAGGLISYGTDLRETNRLAGQYVGRILKGEKPADLPVQQATKNRDRHQLEYCKGARPHHPRNTVGHRRRGNSMRRREFIAGLGSAAAWPVVGRAQPSTLPVIGFLGVGSFDTREEAFVAAFRRGLSAVGFFESRNVTIEHRWTEGRDDQLPTLAADLVRRRVAAIVAVGSTQAALTAKASTQTIPVVFNVGSDPVEIGLVQSLNRPGSNLTGVSLLVAAIVAKRLQLLHELVPAAKSIALLANPANPSLAADETRELEAAARVLGIELVVLHASRSSEIDTAFATLVERKAGALLVSSDSTFSNLRSSIVVLAARYALPAIYQWREYVAAGGLMSYGPDLADAYRVLGVYTGRILKGEKAGDLPVQQVTKIDLTVNMRTAKALGLTIPETLLATADEVIQ